MKHLRGRWRWRQQVIRHFFRTLIHKWFVFLASRKVGGVPFDLVFKHDWSKFGPVERRGYTLHFFCREEYEGNRETAHAYIDIVWKDALRHHYRSNPHHWQYWCDDRYSHPLEMPFMYVREMVADWLAASRTHSGEWPTRNWEWLEKNWSRMQLHPLTRMEVRILLTNLRIRVPPYKGEQV